MPTSKIAPQNQIVSPSQALRVLAASICTSEDLSYGNEDQSFSHNIKKNQTKISDIDVDSMSRDIFYSSNLLGIIEDGISELNFEDQEDLAGIDWDDYFDFENASIVFESATPEESGMDHVLWVANIEKKWLVTCRGYMGEYCDEDFDVTAFFSIYTDISTKEFEKLLSEQLDALVGSEVTSLCNEMSSTQKSLPKAYQHLVQEYLFKHLRRNDMTRPYVALQEKEAIQKGLGLETDSSIPSEKTRKPRAL